MCITAWPARLSETITGTWEVLADGLIHHVIWYQNRVQGANADRTSSREDGLFQGMVEMALTTTPRWDVLAAGFRAIDVNVAKAEVEWRKSGNSARSYDRAKEAVLGIPSTAADAAGGNCLIIPLMGTWESIRLLNTTDTPDILSDIHRAVEFPKARGLQDLSNTWASLAVPAGVGRMVFLKFDVYDIVIAENAESIPAVLPQIDEQKRPEVNPEVFSTFGEWYRCPVAVCCFKSTDQAEAKPIAFAFEPTDPDHLVVYTLDAHDGHAPAPNAEVEVDHTIFVGSYLTPGNHAGRIHFTNEIPSHLRPYVLDYVMGMPDLKTKMPNGDFVFDVQLVRQGVFRGMRQLPPHAPEREAPVTIIARSEAYANGNRPAMLLDR